MKFFQSDSKLNPVITSICEMVQMNLWTILPLTYLSSVSLNANCPGHLSRRTWESRITMRIEPMRIVSQTQKAGNDTIQSSRFKVVGTPKKAITNKYYKDWEAPCAV